jgi:hypothetical protein
MADTDLETPEPVQSPGALLADQMYAAPAEPEPETPTDEVETPPEDEVETPVDEQEETQEVQEPVAANEDEVEVTSLEQLAEHLETDPDWIRGLSVTEKVNGQEVEVSLSDALRTHRQVTAGDEYLADAKTKAKDLIESSTQDKQIVAASAATLGVILNEAKALVDGDMSEADWKRLRREDPAEYSAKKEEIRERRAAIAAVEQKAMAAISQTTTGMNESQRAARDKNLPKEREIFLGLVPDWNDSDVAAKESVEVTEYLKSHGHSPEEIEMAAYNGKLLAYVRNSMMWERSKNKIDASKKKVVKIPKVMKPGKAAEDTKPKGGGDDPVSILYG